MKRHPSIIARERRQMTKARTALHGGPHGAGDVEDARDTDPPPPVPSDMCRVMRAKRNGDWELIANLPRQQAFGLAAALSSRCVVVSLAGKRLFDNKRETQCPTTES